MKKLVILLLVPIVASAQSDTIVFRQQLDSITVRASAALVRQHSSGISIHPQSSILTKGSNALQTLERAPGVALDYRNGGITLNGKAGVRIVLDGKALNLPPEQVTSFLEGLNAESIERIDLLTSPPAGMDAEGGGGVIHIVRKKNRRQGTSGSVTLNAGYGYREKGGGRFQLAHRNKKINVYGSYAFGLDKSYSDMFIPSAQDMPVFGGKMRVLVYDTTRARQLTHDASAGIDYTIDPYTTVGASVSLNRSSRTTRNHTWSDFFLEPDSLLFYRGVIHAETRWSNLLQSVYLDRVKDKRTFSLSADHMLFRNTFPSDVKTNFTDRSGNPVMTGDSAFAPRQLGSSRTVIRVGVLKMDYSWLWGKTKIETGIKGTWTRSNSESGISGRPETMNALVMNEGIAAAYGGVSMAFGTATNVVAGMRYEYASAEMTDPHTKQLMVKRNSGNFFPNLTATLELTETSSFSLSFTRRITRPAYTDLASYVRYSDPTAVYVGNPMLKPSITTNADFRYRYKGWSAALLLSRDRNPIVRYQITENPERTLLYVSPQNLAWQNNLLLQVLIPVQVREWWSMSSSVSGGWKQFRAVHTVAPVEKTYFNWSLNTTQTFRLLEKMSAEISGWYNGPGYNGSVRMNGMGAVNLGVKKELNRNRGVFQLAVSDVFRTLKFTSRYGAVAKEAYAVVNRVDFYTESARYTVFRLSYSRAFGSAGGRRRSAGSGSAEEMERVNSQ